jgi:hypothetical protein
MNKMNMADDLVQQECDRTRIADTLALLHRLGQETKDKRLVGLQRAYTDLDARYNIALETFLNLAISADSQSMYASMLEGRVRPPPSISIEKYMGRSRLDAPY